jgi:peptidoglycan/LPS O-acetylase OafA/YrhL
VKPSIEPQAVPGDVSGVRVIPDGTPALAPKVSARDKRIPSLDGLRAVSIAIVLFGHLTATEGMPKIRIPLGEYANLGVRVFFVISGYLISTLLFMELDKTRRIDLKEFYIRRVFRIFPAFYCFLGAVGLASAFGLLTVPAADMVYAATYTINFVKEKSWYIGHIWSLSVEEQFYLLWPATLAWLGRAKGLRVAFAVLLLAPIARMLWFYILPERQGLITEAFPTVADAIAAGCLLAGVRERLGATPRYVALLRSPLLWLLVAAIVAVNAQPFFRLRWLAGETFMNVGIAVVIDRFIRYPDTLAGRFLNHRAVAFVGVLSYSLYLWQQIFFHSEGGRWWSRFPANVVCVIAAALASYYLVEKPMLSLRQRLKSRPAQPVIVRS